MVLSLSQHQPVLLSLVKKYLPVKAGGKYLDATFGGGSYSAMICRRGGQVLALDWDPLVVAAAKKHPPCPDASWQLVAGNFANLKKICIRQHFLPLAGAVFDLGLASFHYQARRGFAFDDNVPWDMRLSPNLNATALDIVHRLSPSQLAQNLQDLAQEKYAREIALSLKKIVRRDTAATARTISQAVEQIYRRHHSWPGHHPATKTFLALRILVNHELENLRQGLAAAWQLLQPSGRLLVLSFHSGEDRLVKNFMRQKQQRGEGTLVVKNGCRPDETEVKRNRRARSARLRVIEKK